MCLVTVSVSDCPKKGQSGLLFHRRFLLSLHLPCALYQQRSVFYAAVFLFLGGVGSVGNDLLACLVICSVPIHRSCC